MAALEWQKEIMKESASFAALPFIFFLINYQKKKGAHLNIAKQTDRWPEGGTKKCRTFRSGSKLKVMPSLKPLPLIEIVF